VIFKLDWFLREVYLEPIAGYQVDAFLRESYLRQAIVLVVLKRIEFKALLSRGALASSIAARSVTGASGAREAIVAFALQRSAVLVSARGDAVVGHALTNTASFRGTLLGQANGASSAGAFEASGRLG
jgi:hypothetical protein